MFKSVFLLISVTGSIYLSAQKAKIAKPTSGNTVGRAQRWCSIRDYLCSILPGLANFPINRVAELTPAAWRART